MSCSPPSAITSPLQEEGSSQHWPPQWKSSRFPGCCVLPALSQNLHADGRSHQASKVEDAWAILATLSCVLGLRAASPVKQQVQHLLGGGKGSVSAQEDGDIGGIIALEG